MIQEQNTKSAVTINSELLTLLEKVNNDSMIGLCIQYALRSNREEELLRMLKDMADDNPRILMLVLGRKAFLLLKQ